MTTASGARRRDPSSAVLARPLATTARHRVRSGSTRGLRGRLRCRRFAECRRTSDSAEDARDRDPRAPAAALARAAEALGLSTGDAGRRRSSARRRAPADGAAARPPAAAAGARAGPPRRRPPGRRRRRPSPTRPTSQAAKRRQRIPFWAMPVARAAAALGVHLRRGARSRRPKAVDRPAGAPARRSTPQTASSCHGAERRRRRRLPAQRRLGAADLPDIEDQIALRRHRAPSPTSASPTATRTAPVASASARRACPRGARSVTDQEINDVVCYERVALVRPGPGARRSAPPSWSGRRGDRLAGAGTRRPEHRAAPRPADSRGARGRRRPVRRGGRVLAGSGGPRRPASSRRRRSPREDVRRRPHAPGRPPAPRHGPRPSELADFHRFDGLRAIAHGITLELEWPEHPDFPSYGYVVRRRDLDQMVADNAVKAGATLWQGTEAIAPVVERGLVRGAVVQRTSGTTTRCGPATWWSPTAPTRRFGRALGTGARSRVPAGHGDPRLLREPAARRPVDRVARST